MPSDPAPKPPVAPASFTGPPAPTFVPLRIPPQRPQRADGDANLPNWLRRSIPIAFFLAAFLILGARMDEPSTIVFDEAHYVRWGREIAKGHLLEDQHLRGNTTLSHIAVNFEHPPLAKHLIAGTFRATGTGHLGLSWDQYHLGCEKAATEDGGIAGKDPCPAGVSWPGCEQPHPECARDAAAWRFPSVVAGSLGVAFAYILGLRVFHNVWAGILAAGFLLLDTMWYLMSRMAMLDVFAAAFVVGALAFALARRPASHVVCALFFGAAISSKYTAFFLLPAVLVLLYARAPSTNPLLRVLYALGLGLVLPVAVWVASYAQYFQEWMEIGGPGFAAGQFIVVQIAAAHWDFGADFEHGSASPPWAWIPHIEPTFYYHPTHPDYQPPLMYAVGNIVTWWPATLVALTFPAYAITRWFKTRDRAFPLRHRFQAMLRRPLVLTPTLSLSLASLLLVFSYVPWFLLPRTSFNYYATLNAPFFALVAAGLSIALWQWRPLGRAAALTHLAMAGGLFTLWWPIVSGADVPERFFDVVWYLVPWMSR